MKRLLLAIAILLLATSAWAWGPVMMGGGVESGATCDTSVQASTDYTNDVANGAIYVANKFTASGGYTVCAVQETFKKNASETSDLVIELWSHDSGNDTPDSVIVSSETIANSAISAATMTDAKTNLVSPYTLSNGTTYWIVRKKTSSTAYALGNAVGNTSPERMMYSADGLSWTVLETTRGAKFVLYSQ